jgi:hypothetical protein
VSEDPEVSEKLGKLELARLRAYENAIDWHTTCLNCARLLESGYADLARAEKAEADLARAWDIHRRTCLIAVGDLKDSAFTCELCALLEKYKNPPQGSLGEGDAGV